MHDNFDEHKANTLSQIDELTLVDIAVLFFDNFKAFCICLICYTLIAAAIIFVLFDGSYKVNSILQIGTMEDRSTIEEIHGVAHRLKSTIIPCNVYLTDENVSKSNFVVAIPLHSNLVQISSKVNPKNKELYSNIHRNALETILNEHNEIYKTRLEIMGERISQLDNDIKKLEKNNQLDSIDGLYDSRITLLSLRDSLSPSRIRVIAQRNNETVGASIPMLAAAMVFSVTILSIFTTFIVEFFKRVKRAIRER